MSSYPANVIVQLHFNKNRGLAHCIGWLGFSIGFMISPGLTEALIHQYSWKGTTLLLGGILLHRMPLTLTFQPPKVKRPSLGEDLNEDSPQTCSEISASFIDCSLIKHHILLIFLMSDFLIRLYMDAFFHHLPSYAVHHGCSTSQAATAATIVNSASAIVRIIIAFVSNIKGVNRLLIHTFGTVIACASILVLLLVRKYVGVLVACALAGCNIGRFYFLIQVFCYEDPNLIICMLPRNQRHLSRHSG